MVDFDSVQMTVCSFQLPHEMAGRINEGKKKDARSNALVGTYIKQSFAGLAELTSTLQRFTRAPVWVSLLFMIRI